jgi:hypothetical protein
MSTETTAQTVAGLVTSMCEALFDDVEELRGLVEKQLVADEPRRADLEIEERCLALLTDRGRRAAGAGLVMAPGVLVDAPYWLEWWTSDPDAPVIEPRRLAAETDPRAVGFRDYTQLLWYAEPLATGKRHVTGPYVDYLCTDQQTLTLTTPVWRGGEFAGVVGVDLLVRSLEERFFAALAGVPGRYVVINSMGRVVTATDVDLVTGDLLRGLPVGDWWAGRAAAETGWEFHPCSDLPLGVISAH